MKRRISTLLLVMAMIAALVLPVSSESLISTDDFPDVLARAKQGVVQLYSVGYSHGSPVASWTGSGFAVGRSGQDSDVFVTNWHCVTGSGEFSVSNIRVWILKEDCSISRVDGSPDPARSVECEVLKTTLGYPDYAIIRAKTSVSGYKALPLMASDDVPDGTTVYALGYPGEMDDISATHSGIDDITSTDGIVSKHMVFTEAGDTRVLLHTAVISHGNSGGPLITSQGAVVGINTYGTSVDADRYYAVYSDYAMQGLDDLGIDYDIYKGKTTRLSTAAIVGIAVAAGAAVIVVAVMILAKQRKEDQNTMQEALSRAVAELHAVEERRQREAAARHAEARNRAAVSSASQYSLKLPDSQVKPIPKTGMTIGRSRRCTLALPENMPGVSGRHCKLVFMQGRLVVIDQGSTYGTLIHGQKIPPNQPVALRVGSSFALGGQQNTFTILEREK